MAGIRLTGQRPRGVTLIEMLVVISILVMLMGIGVPLMAPAMEGRRTREASRQLNVYLGAARNRAMATGKPVGVMIHPFEGLTQCSMVVDKVECPPPYNGDTLTAFAGVQLTGVGTVNATLTDFNMGLISVGDIAQFNHQGPYYIITQLTGAGFDAALYNPQAQLLPWPSSGTSPAACTIFRRPLKSLSAPLQLPTGAVIDLQYSGTDTASFGSGSGPIIILFSSNGAVDRVYSNTIAGRAMKPIHLLVGKREKIPTAAGDENWRDFNNLWVTLNPQTGLVTTNQVASTNSINESRAFALQALSKGGR